MELTRWARLGPTYLTLTGETCNGCNIKIFPPRDVCPECGASGTIYDAPKPSSEVSPELAVSKSSK